MYVASFSAFLSVVQFWSIASIIYLITSIYYQLMNRACVFIDLLTIDMAKLHPASAGAIIFAPNPFFTSFLPLCPLFL
jgi:hypothetical protein